METFFSIGGIAVSIASPFPFTVEQVHRPFFMSGIPDGKTGITHLKLIPVSSLPERPGNWFGDECRFYHKAFPDLTWFSLWPDTEPFAVGDYSLAPDCITVKYLVAQQDLMSASRTLLRILEPERLFNLYGGFMLHGSLVLTDKGGIVFSGPSGMGKSTQASLWEQYAGAEVLNGDRCALMPGEHGWTGWGLPFAGTSGIYRNESTPLKGVVMLEQAAENSVLRVGFAEAFSYLYPQINHHRWNKELVGRTTDALIQLWKDIPVYKLVCRPEEGAVAVLRREVFGDF